MEAIQPAATGPCPPWCVTDHKAPFYPDKPQFGMRASHFGPNLELGSMHVQNIHHPGHEPEISVYNYLSGIRRLHISVTEAKDFLGLIRWLAKGGSSTVREFASLLEEAVSAIEQGPDHVPDGDGGR